MSNIDDNSRPKRNRRRPLRRRQLAGAVAAVAIGVAGVSVVPAAQAAENPFVPATRRARPPDPVQQRARPRRR